MEIYPKFCPDTCRYLSPWENTQSVMKENHICVKYKKRVFHGKFHPKLLMLKECTKYNIISKIKKKEGIMSEPKVNWLKVPFEIIAMFVMIAVWGSKATHRMIASETTYQKEINDV